LFVMRSVYGGLSGQDRPASSSFAQSAECRGDAAGPVGANRFSVVRVPDALPPVGQSPGSPESPNSPVHPKVRTSLAPADQSLDFLPRLATDRKSEFPGLLEEAMK